MSLQNCVRRGTLNTWLEIRYYFAEIFIRQKPRLCIPPWISCKSSVNKLIGLLTALVGLLEQFCWSQPEYLNFMIKDWELIVWAGTQNTVRFPRQEEGHSVTGVGKQETPQFCLLVYSNVGFDIRLGIYQRPPAFLSTVQHEHLCWNTK